MSPSTARIPNDVESGVQTRASYQSFSGTAQRRPLFPLIESAFWNTMTACREHNFLIPLVRLRAGITFRKFKPSGELGIGGQLNFRKSLDTSWKSHKSITRKVRKRNRTKSELNGQSPVKRTHTDKERGHSSVVRRAHVSTTSLARHSPS